MRVWAKLTHVVVYTPGFLALLLLKVGEPTSGITVELLMLASTAAIVAGLFMGTQSNEAGADHSSRVSAWSGVWCSNCCAPCRSCAPCRAVS